MTFDPSLAVQLADATSRLEADPLAAFEFAGDLQRRFVEYVAAGIETYIRLPNKGGKSFLGSRLGVAMSRGLSYLGRAPADPRWAHLLPVVLPVLRMPNVGVVLIPSYGQSSEAVVAHYKDALGEYPWDEAKISGSMGYTGMIYVGTSRCRHRGSSHCRHCSKIYFVSGEGTVPAGFQVDWIHADEPPSEEHWRELRFRSRANSTLYSWITATPIKKSAFAWLRRDFKDCLDVPKNGRVELAGGIETNRFLSAEYVAKTRRAAANDPYARARLYGEYVDISGSCPFSYEGLQRWLKRSERPRLHAFREVEIDGEARLELVEHGRGHIEVYAEPEPAGFYLLAADPSMGLKEPDKTDAEQQTNPSAINVIEGYTGRHCLRYVGYTPAGELGRMARVICERYNRAMFMPEMNGGYGETMLQGFGLDYSNVYEDIRMSDRGAHRPRKVGWYQTHSKRGLIVSTLQRAINEDSLDLRSAAAIQALMNISYDRNEKPTEGSGGRGPHGEDMITLGMLCYAVTVPGVLPPRDLWEAQQGVAVESLRDLLRRGTPPPGEQIEEYGGRQQR